jgi:hypothetical protein
MFRGKVNMAGYFFVFELSVFEVPSDVPGFAG